MLELSRTTTTPDISTKDLKAIMEEIDKVLYAGRFELLDILYLNYPTPQMATVDKAVLVALMRCPYVVRDKFTNWKSFVQRVASMHGEDLVQGLLR